jgi:serine/threonine-protein kinase
MTLSSGMRLGPYEVAALIGAGGMGQVYEARDTRLGRDVAIKLLHVDSAATPEARQRLEREARAVAALQHPNICTLFDVGETPDGHAYLVMERLHGETVRERLVRGTVPADEVIDVAVSLADALETAHAAGIVHRDLKPANIMLTPRGPKILDFGVAKTPVAVPDAVTASGLATEPGIRIGTVAYMSPEQLRGEAVDARSDVFSFGLVLYEMITGRRAFSGDGAATVPAPLEAVVRKALEPDRALRYQHAAELRSDLLRIKRDRASTVAIAAPRPRRVPPLAIVALAGGAVIAALVVSIVMRPAPVAPLLPARFAILSPAAQPLNISGLDRNLALSPDGHRLVYRAAGSLLFGSPLLVRALDDLDARPIPGISGAFGPFFSPDGRWIGFFERGELKKVSLAGGPPITLCRISGRSLGASWGDDNTIVYATTDRTTGLWRVSADGGATTALTSMDAAERGGDHWFPSVLPGGRGVLFTITAERHGDSAQVAVLDLTTAQRKILIRGGTDAQYLDSGHLVYAAGGALRAVQFDLARLEVLGEPVPVVDSVMTTANGAANYAVSQRGTLVYVPGGAYAVTTSPRSLVWVDREGREEPIRAPARPYGVPRVSPDGTRVAVELLDQENDIWIWDFARQTLMRLTTDAGFDVMPLWTPDSRRIIFASTRAGVPNLYTQPADGTDPVDRLGTNANSQMATSITSDGTKVIGFEESRVILHRLPGSPSGQPAAPSQTLFSGFIPEFSPDGRYIAYQSNESGTNEVYVRPFPQVDSGRWQVSTGGGTRPAWGRNGRELFYLDASQKLTGVAVQTTGPTFIAGIPVKVLDTKYANPFPARWYDVSPNGERFLMIKDTPAAEHATPISMIVVEHWYEELETLVHRTSVQ